MQTVVKVDVSTPDYASMIKAKLLKITGKVDLEVLRALNRHKYTYIDISEAEFGIEEIRANMNHNSLYKVDVLRRFLAHIKADTVLLPFRQAQQAHQRALGNQPLPPLRLRKRNADEQEENHSNV